MGNHRQVTSRSEPLDTSPHAFTLTHVPLSGSHGGGYSWRLCKADGNITEQCFQAGHLEFAGQSQWIRYPNGSQAEMPLRMTDIGTTPSGSQWARDPVRAPSR